jgi:protein-tyrosine phosphatase
MELTELPYSFQGKIFRSAMPFSAYDPGGELLQAFKDNEVSLVVLLASDQECLRYAGRDLRTVYQEEGTQVYYFPISDFGVPQIEEVNELVPEVLAHSNAGGNIVIHCHAGLGRTGMIAACIAKMGLGYSSEEAVLWVRQYIPGAVEVPGQEQLIREV